MESKTKPAIIKSDALIKRLESFVQDSPIYVSLTGTAPHYVISHIEDSTLVGWYELRIRAMKHSNQNCLDTVEKLVRSLKSEADDDFIYATECHSAPMEIITEIIHSEEHQCYLIVVEHDVYFDDVKWLQSEIVILD